MEVTFYLFLFSLMDEAIVFKRHSTNLIPYGYN